MVTYTLHDAAGEERRVLRLDAAANEATIDGVRVHITLARRELTRWRKLAEQEPETYRLEVEI